MHNSDSRVDVFLSLLMWKIVWIFTEIFTFSLYFHKIIQLENALKKIWKLKHYFTNVTYYFPLFKFQWVLIGIFHMRKKCRALKRLITFKGFHDKYLYTSTSARIRCVLLKKYILMFLNNNLNNFKNSV